MIVMWKLSSFAFLAAVLLAPVPACADVVTALPTKEKVIALTFDACEQGKPVAFDRAVLDYLLDNRIPFTVFVTGRFVQTNTEDVTELSKLDFVEIENHSWSHPNHMEKLSLTKVRDQVVRAQAAIEAATGRQPQFFRFPAGNYNRSDLKLIESLGYKVVHWSWATGDPSPLESRNGLIRRAQVLTQPGNILIFHINGRGVHTAEALPVIIDDLRKRGFRFAKLADYLGDHPAKAPIEVSVANQVRQFLALLYFKQTAPPRAALPRRLN
ncbi:MAG: polysaccharide deacetylase family protein [Alphaproteobacteria bacterium]|nr:polysaccharide deacetylase family protein [Alphaproteobacteria bacterium]